MAVLVTGGAGYIGSHVVLDLLDNGEDVVVLDDLSTGFAWAVPAEVPLVTGDIGSASTVRRVIDEHEADAIVHLAGSVVVSDSARNPLAYYCNNSCKTWVLVGAAVDAGIRAFVFASTSAVYGDCGSRRVREGDRTDPISPYGRSKLAAEMIVRDAGEAHGLPYAILRFANAAGADRAGRAGQATKGATHLVKVACEAMVTPRPRVTIYGNGYSTPDGTCVRDYVHVSDIAEAHGRALARLRTGGASFFANLGSGRGRSVLEVLDAVGRVTGRRIDYSVASPRSGDVASIVLDNTRASDVLCWTPQRGLDDIVTDALAWERKLVARERAA